MQVIMEGRTFPYFGKSFLLCKVSGPDIYFSKMLQGRGPPVMGMALKEILEELGIFLPAGHGFEIIFRSRNQADFSNSRFKEFLVQNNISQEFVPKSFPLPVETHGLLTGQINQALQVHVLSGEE